MTETYKEKKEREEYEKYLKSHEGELYRCMTWDEWRFRHLK